eukprot:774513-Prymnesium_polylepis.1
MESTMYNVDPKLHDVLRTLVITRQLQRFSPDALYASVAYSPTVEYLPIRGPLNEQAVTSATIGSHLTTRYYHHGYTFDNVTQITPRDW